jgi:hypothetical protein
MPVIIKKAPFHRCFYGVFVVKMRFVAKTGDTVINRAEHGGKRSFLSQNLQKRLSKSAKIVSKSAKKTFFSGWVLHLLLKLINFVTELKL